MELRTGSASLWGAQKSEWVFRVARSQTEMGAPALTSHGVGAVPGRGWPRMSQTSPQGEATPEA